MRKLSEDQAWNTAGFTEVFDISTPLGTVASYPGDKLYALEWISRIEDGSDFDLSALTLSSHAGAHLDAPAHLIKGARTIDQYSLRRFLVPAQVISVIDGESIEPSALQGIDIRSGDALLFQTSNSSRGLLQQRDFREPYIYLSLAAARLCVALGASLVGIDCLSVDRYGDDAAPAHHSLLESDVLILEGIDLLGLSPGRYLLLCLPLKISGGEAAPVRAVLVR